MSRYTAQLLEEARTRLTQRVALLTPREVTDLITQYDEARRLWRGATIVLAFLLGAALTLEVVFRCP